MKRKFKRLTTICLAVAFLASCEGIFPTHIGDILKSPRDYADKQVSISGTVVEAMSLLVVKYFVVQDNTGQITVITDKPLPQKGEKIKVKGTVQEAFSLGDQQLIVLVEKSGG